MSKTLPSLDPYERVCRRVRAPVTRRQFAPEAMTTQR
jgi:hypothetical protein